MYRQDFHLQTLTCLAIAISPLCKHVPHWFGFCVRFLEKNFNSLQTWSFICCNSWTNTDVHTARHQIWDNVSAGTFRLGLSGLKKPCSFNSILVVTNPNFFAWVSAAVCTDKNSFFRHWQCLALPFPHFTSLFHIHVAKPAETFDFSLLYKLVSHSCGKACRNVLASDPKWKNRKSDIFDTVKFGSGHIEQSCSSTFQNQHVSTLFWSSCSVVRYIDTSTISFSLHRKEHLQTSACQVFTDLDFSGSPVELELVFIAFSLCIGLKSRAHLIQYS